MSEFKKHPETSGEKIIRKELVERGYKVITQKRILYLKDDIKQFRVADFYLPELKLYIEYLGRWDNSDEKIREEYREENRIKKRVYSENNIECVWLYPNHLKSLDFILDEKIPKLNKETKNHRTKEKYTWKNPLDKKKNNPKILSQRIWE